MKHATRPLASALLLSLIALAGPTARAEKADFQQLLPAEPQFYAHWAGRSLTFDGSMLGQMIQQGRFDALTANVRHLLLRDAPQGQRAELDKLWALLRIGWQHPTALAAGGLTPNTKPFLIVLADLGKDRADFEKHLQGLLNERARLVGKPLQTTAVGKHTFTVLQDAPPTTVGLAGNLLVFTVGDGLNQLRLNGKPGSGLAGNTSFQAALAEVAGKDVQLAFYADLDGLVTGLAGPRPQGKPEPGSGRAILDALGLGNAQSLAGTLRVVDKGMLTTVRLNTPGPHTGLLAPLAGPAPLNDADLAGLPAGTSFVMAIKDDPDRLFGEFVHILAALEPREADALVLNVLKPFRKEVGFDLRKELLATLGPTCRLSVAPGRAGMMLGGLLSFDVSDEKTLRASLGKLRKALQGSDGGRVRVETLRTGETTVHYLANLEDSLPLLPAWCVHNKKLHVALWPQVIASALADRSPPLVKSAEFNALRKRLPKNPTVLLYADTPALVQQLYPVCLLGGASAGNFFGRNNPQARLATWPGTLQQAVGLLQPSMTVLTHDEKGITLSGFGSLPAPLTDVPAVLAETFGMFLPALSEARHTAQQTLSMSQLRLLLLGCMMHSTEHDGRLPTSLEQLLEAGYIEPSGLRSPASGRPAPRWDKKDKKLIGKADYILFDYGGIDLSKIPNDAMALLAYERPENFRPDEDIPVGFVDGHVERLSRERLKQLLAEAQALRTKHTGPVPPQGKEDF